MASGNTIFSTKLQALRKKQGVTQEQLANYLGVSPQAVSKWENGNYPEGDLLPKISEYFGVSISYLYGQEKEEVSIEQSVLDALIDVFEKDGKDGEFNGHPQYFDKMLKLAWAFQIGCWKNNKCYYDRGEPEKGNRTASVLTDNMGYSYFNLNPENQFFMLVKEPENGFVKNITISEQMRAFFGFLGKKGVLEIIYYLLTLRWGEYVTASNIAKNIGFSIEKTQELLQEIGKYQGMSNPPFYCIDIINEDGVEKGYGINQAGVCLYISLFLQANALIYSPFGYQMQITMRGKSWFDRKHVEEMIKEK